MSLLMLHSKNWSSVPEQIHLRTTPDNPALPASRHISHKRTNAYATTSRGTGVNRVYLDFQSQPPNVAYPPRPVPGSVVDFDIVMDHCDFSRKKVRIVHLVHLLTKCTRELVRTRLFRSPQDRCRPRQWQAATKRENGRLEIPLLGARFRQYHNPRCCRPLRP